MKKLLVIAHNWPAPNYSAAGVRLMQLVSFFKKENYQITIASTADKSSINDLDFKNIKLESILLNDDSFDVFVKDLNPDVVVFDRFMTEEQFGWRVSENVPNTLRILDTEDIHSLRKSREEALKNNDTWTTAFWREYDMTKREVASILRSDLSLIISSFEMELLKAVVPNHKDLLLHLPFMVDQVTDDLVMSWPSFQERKDFIFIGFGGHTPNIDAIEYLKNDIWPSIHKEVPEAKIHVYGGNLPEKINQLNNRKEGFLIHGWVEDATTAMSNSKVLLAPLRFGAGQKGKLLEAMRCGTPSVTTVIGAEGMHNNLDWNGTICNNPKQFANAAIEIYQNKTTFKLFQQNGLKILDQNFDKTEFEEKLKFHLDNLQKDLLSHRHKNFIGGLLQHQTMASTKFMSRWIAEKSNKL